MDSDTASDSQPITEDHVAALRVVYEHLESISKKDAEAEALFLAKVRFYVGVVVAVYAAMTFGVARSEWAMQPPNYHHGVILGVIGLLAAIGLFVAFWNGIRCHMTREASAVGVKRLKQNLENDSAEWWQPFTLADTYRGRSINLADAIIRNRADDARRTPWANRLLYATRAGTILAAIFVLYAVAGDTVYGSTDHPVMENAMPDPEPGKDKPLPHVELPDKINSDADRDPRQWETRTQPRNDTGDADRN